MANIDMKYRLYQVLSLWPPNQLPFLPLMAVLQIPRVLGILRPLRLFGWTLGSDMEAAPVWGEEGVNENVRNTLRLSPRF